MRKKIIKLKRWKVQVSQDHVATLREQSYGQDYVVIAADGMDARIIAFALNSGFSDSKVCMDEGDIELVKTYTKIV